MVTRIQADEVCRASRRNSVCRFVEDTQSEWTLIVQDQTSVALRRVASAMVPLGTEHDRAYNRTSEQLLAHHRRPRYRQTYPQTLNRRQYVKVTIPICYTIQLHGSPRSSTELPTYILFIVPLLFVIR